ncbi:beta-lactamase family protein [Ideonella sp. 4Y11]|uniref:Beta-lactamase family protein n=1 Tax=Ideonella aquatica TaxID=2824119 RepID=A0A941BLE3_9BURK|nr:serine hydrolase domain-containing protein [Ideonella aquatica]MBQ0959609.1 beta-lactamase family protein [Ideonella aquatica]
MNPHHRPSWASPGRRGLLLAIAAALAGCATSRRSAAWQPDAAMLAALPDEMRQAQVPAVSIAVLEEGELVWQHQQGLANAQTGQVLAPRALFEAASLTKPLFAWLVLRLASEGQLVLDEPLVHTLRPAWVDDHHWNARITARHVLSHTSGLPNWRRQPLEQTLRAASEPGTRLSYSGEAFFWLQLVVEQRTGLALPRLAQRLLFQPAGMQDSDLAWSDDVARRAVWGHAAPRAACLVPLPRQMMREAWLQAMPLATAWGRPLADWRWDDAQRAFNALGSAVPSAAVAWPGDLMSNAAASLRCTAADYARFLRVLMPAAAGPRLAPAWQRLFTEPQFETRPPWSAKTLGWNLERTAAGPLLYHAGNNAEQFRAFALADPARGRALVVLTNGGGGDGVFRAVISAATGLRLRAFDP